jgi:hypothetical protein
MSGPGPLTRSASRKDARAAPYKKGESTGLTKYMGEINLGFDEVESKSGKKKLSDKSDKSAVAPEVGTVVVSCSALILESKQIVNDGAVTKKLDALYAKHKAKEISPQQALEQLTALVGQTTVEQAGLVLSNIQTGTLPPGWVEYFDPQRGLPYYHNPRTKTTTWQKPSKSKQPPPPPPPPQDSMEEQLSLSVVKTHEIAMTGFL